MIFCSRVFAVGVAQTEYSGFFASQMQYVTSNIHTRTHTHTHRCGLRDAASAGPSPIAARDFNLFLLEAEIGFIMSCDLPPRPDASGGCLARGEQEVWRAVEEVVLCVELVGRRFAFDEATQLEKLTDTMCSGG